MFLNKHVLLFKGCLVCAKRLVWCDYVRILNKFNQNITAIRLILLNILKGDVCPMNIRPGIYDISWWIKNASLYNAAAFTKTHFSSLASGRSGISSSFSKLTVIKNLRSEWYPNIVDIAVSWMPILITDDKTKLFQVMACCRQTTSHTLD